MTTFASEDKSQYSPEELEWLATAEVEINDPDAFIQYKRLQRSIDKLAVISAGTLTYTIKSINRAAMLSDIIDMPEDFQDKVEARFKLYCVQQSKLQNLSRAAFGIEGNVAKGVIKKNKLSSLLLTRKMDLIEMFSRMFTIKEVLAHVREEWTHGRDLTLADLKDFHNQNVELINRGIETHKTDWSGMRLVAKKSRLEELTWSANIVKKRIEKNQHRDDIKLHANLLDQIRKECEGEKILIEGNINTNIQMDVNVHMRNNIMGNIPLREIILARVAARNGTTPLFVLSDLNNSYYAKINTLINGGEFVDFEEIGTFPSQQPYDFDFIKRVNQQADQNRVVEKQQIEQTQTARNMIGDPIKERLLAILSQNQDSIRAKQIE